MRTTPATARTTPVVASRDSRSWSTTRARIAVLTGIQRRQDHGHRERGLGARQDEEQVAARVADRRQRSSSGSTARTPWIDGARPTTASTAVTTTMRASDVSRAAARVHHDARALVAGPVDAQEEAGKAEAGHEDERPLAESPGTAGCGIRLGERPATWSMVASDAESAAIGHRHRDDRGQRQQHAQQDDGVRPVPADDTDDGRHGRRDDRRERCDQPHGAP